MAQPGDVTAIVMAGGRSERMRASLASPHKALVTVLGVPLLERNVTTLLSHGFRRIVVSTSPREPEIVRYVTDRVRGLATWRGATVSCLVETEPMGTVGAVAELDPAAAVLVVNVDNLTALDLAHLVAAHRASGAEMTIATHREPFCLPFGELRLRNGQVTGYIEKPVRPVPISSGTYVLSPGAVTLIPRGCRTDIPELVARLLALNHPIHAYEHSAPWIDVNDATALRAAEDLLLDRSGDFEQWRSAPAVQMWRLVHAAATHLVLVRRPDDVATYPGAWDLVPGALTDGDAGPHGLGLEVSFRHVAFDDLDLRTGTTVRHHLVLTDTPVSCEGSPVGSDVLRVGVEDTAPPASLSPPLLRVLAILRARRRRQRAADAAAGAGAPCGPPDHVARAACHAARPR